MQAVPENEALLLEDAQATIVGDYICTIRENDAIEVLHNAKECWGSIRMAPKDPKLNEETEETGDENEDNNKTLVKEDNEDKKETEKIAENTLPLQISLPGELRLMHEEELYLASQGRIRLNPQAKNHYEDVCRRSGTPDFGRMYRAYCYFRAKGYVVKVGLQFGCDYLLYRGSPDEFHAEVCALIIGGGNIKSLSWRRLKTLARLAQDVRKRLTLCHVPDDPQGEIFDVLVDDAFQRPPDTAISAKRKAKNTVITAEARKRHRASAQQEYMNTSTLPSHEKIQETQLPRHGEDDEAPLEASEYSEIAELLGCGEEEE
mmetsp:Transcript_8413/g.11716  ORF Transcript_8413/g.11716 Transcript_8413/m.11716 type:complete len:318 (+) Transcript_8413:44-997(+)|eukprot:CAMPEP_0197303562 /NCGR_PEP_ID=MMETSP0890-20130614/51730_1 /TAXON_ID=44058 ORGANISM="Aureoumbra lagunensis, Strain CCMP1510" /NCGR_SAMPLE_ID=MMETSP0890 /ASSEMBLY_ACC=CAM_ASM_000533 /LENGTH=317 /DNA_ID=CAMNT_0042783405 /DNA_START=43 /DNA_END=996 /DNA_ORIENTATION=+